LNAELVFFAPEARKPIANLKNKLEVYGEFREGGGEKWTEEKLVNAAHDWDFIIVTSREQITSKVINAATKLKAILKIGVGVENIDIGAATERKIPVANCPGANAIAVAETAVGLMLASSRRIPEGVQKLINGEWRNSIHIGNEMTGATFGIVGLGNIGSKLAKMLSGFGGRILAYDPYVSSEKFDLLEVESSSFADLLKLSDFISIHCSLTDETKYLFDKSTFGQMKSSAIIVNCARGPVIDEKALLDALRTNQIAGAGLDVFESEPPDVLNPIFTLPNVVATPHLAGATNEAREKINDIVFQNIELVIRGEQVMEYTLLNPEVY
tara:strand:- start:8584 stop:9561 length:978 start_codon:yes stop_codon:yes gene_type:complete